MAPLGTVYDYVRGKSTAVMCGTRVAGARYRMTSHATACVYFILASISAVISEPDSGDQRPATSSRTLRRTSGCDSRRATAHSSDEVEAS